MVPEEFKLKRFKLKDGLTKEAILNAGFKEDNASYVHKDAKYSKWKFKEFPIGAFSLELSITIVFCEDINSWNDFDNTLMIDEDFGQPFTPFYVEMNKQAENKTCITSKDGALYWSVNFWNETMSSMPTLFEEITDNE